jgi:hypothetical protein
VAVGAVIRRSFNSLPGFFCTTGKKCKNKRQYQNGTKKVLFSSHHNKIRPKKQNGIVDEKVL